MLDDLCKAPLACKIREKTFEISPLTQGDVSQLLRLIRFRDWNELREAGADKETLAAVMQECRKCHPTLFSDAFNDTSKEPWLQLEIAFLALRGRQPDLTREQLEKWPLGDVDCVAAVAFILSFAHENPDEAKKKLDEFQAKTKNYFSIDK